ncbi:hypothetical protein [Sphingomonas sp. 37zxx]|uniref:hypothetical protein n=1 Tax=Sphingomonas sp. 37zxx TaxID=1550073 RepID=UPI001038864D|nr:hypothetical protein [Sphingomonas sp. 37zxx]
MPGLAAPAAAATLQARPIEGVPQDGERHWPGAPYWADRLQDWRRSGRWIECLCGEAGMELRSVARLTRSLVD